MNENTTRIFQNNGLHHQLKTLSSGSPQLPTVLDPELPDDRMILSPLARRMQNRPSIDVRLREALRPVINDRSVLRPDRYQALMADTQTALIQQEQNERESDAREALANLTLLLEDNTEMMSLLNQFIHHVRKA